MSGHPVMKTVHSLIENDGNKVLNLTFDDRQVKPGERIPKGEAQGLPKLTWNAAPVRGQKLIVVSLDLDAPFPSFAILSPVLHWLQAGFTVDAASGDLVGSEPAIASWAGPGPPPISSPHRYVFLLYEQPEDFDAKVFIKATGYGIRDRMRWDLSKFEKQVNLGHAVAATYFLSN